MRGREVKVLLGLGITVVLCLAAFAFVMRPQESSATVQDGRGSVAGQAGPAATSSRLVREDSPVLGAPDARVTMVEFLDPECESCRAAFPSVKRLLSEYDGQVKLVVRYFPLHGNSVLAANATEAAGEQGKYWEMQELLFARQSEWGEQSAPQTEKFLEYGRSLGLDMDAFTGVLQSSKYQAKIERDRADGAALGVRGTPIIFVNGQGVRDFSYAGMKAAIDAALRS